MCQFYVARALKNIRLGTNKAVSSYRLSFFERGLAHLTTYSSRTYFAMFSRLYFCDNESEREVELAMNILYLAVKVFLINKYFPCVAQNIFQERQIADNLEKIKF